MNKCVNEYLFLSNTLKPVWNPKQWNPSSVAMLSFLYCFLVKGKLISAKSFPLVGFAFYIFINMPIPISCKIYFQDRYVVLLF